MVPLGTQEVYSAQHPFRRADPEGCVARRAPMCDTAPRYIDSIYRGVQCRASRATGTPSDPTEIRGVHEVLELAILGLLQEQPRHGYELKKRLSETLGSFWGISFGSLYPALRRLERSGAIEVVDGSRRRVPCGVPAMPATGSLKGEAAAARLRLVPAPAGRRTRKAYRITPIGQEQFQTLLTADDVGDDERLFSLEARVLPLPRSRVAPGLPRAPAHRAGRPPRPGPPHARTGRRSLHPLPLGASQPIHRARPRVARRLDRKRRPDARRRRPHLQPERARTGRSDRMSGARQKIRVAIAGVGNCSSSLLQGVEYYRTADPAESVPGLMHVELGGYHVGDVEFVAAFDVDAAKVGLDLGKAVFAGQNNTIRFADVPETGVLVQRGADARRPRQVLPPDRRGVPGRTRRRGPGAARLERRRARLVPARRLRGRAEVLRAVLPGHGRRVRQRDPGVHRERPGVGEEVHGRERPDRR